MVNHHFNLHAKTQEFCPVFSQKLFWFFCLTFWKFTFNTLYDKFEVMWSKGEFLKRPVDHFDRKKSIKLLKAGITLKTTESVSSEWILKKKLISVALSAYIFLKTTIYLFDTKTWRTLSKSKEASYHNFLYPSQCIKFNIFTKMNWNFDRVLVKVWWHWVLPNLYTAWNDNGVLYQFLNLKSSD